MKVAYLATGRADVSVGVTVKTFGVGGLSGLAVRCSDATHFIRVGRDNIATYNGGTVTVLATFAQPFADGDRMRVDVVSNAILVSKNNVVVWSGASTFNQTATNHGLWAST